MATVRFQELRVYLLAEELSDLIWGIAKKWDIFARDTIGKQIVRSVDSVGANLAEGCGRQSFQDNKRFVKIARGSLNETQHWLRRAFRRGLLTDSEIKKLQAIIDELAPKLNAYLRSIGPATGGRTKDK